ncbi:MAG: ferritin [Anaerolinea sp.]
MLSKRLLDEMNTQIKLELYSAYLYLAMAAHFEENNWGGFAKWMAMQAKEEQEHALKFFEYIHDRGGKVTLQAIDAPPSAFGTPEEIFAEVLKHEQSVTARIHLLYSIAVEDKDYASQEFLNWFVKEQVEEEKNATQVLEWLKMASGSTPALFQINALLAQRED